MENLSINLKSSVCCEETFAATSLKMLLKNRHSVKCYDKLNMNELTLSLWENFWWGLIYFDQFITILFQFPLLTHALM